MEDDWPKSLSDIAKNVEVHTISMSMGILIELNEPTIMSIFFLSFFLSLKL